MPSANSSGCLVPLQPLSLTILRGVIIVALCLLGALLGFFTYRELTRYDTKEVRDDDPPSRSCIGHILVQLSRGPFHQFSRPSRHTLCAQFEADYAALVERITDQMTRYLRNSVRGAARDTC